MDDPQTYFLYPGYIFVSQESFLRHTAPGSVWPFVYGRVWAGSGECVIIFTAIHLKVSEMGNTVMSPRRYPDIQDN